MTKSKQKTQNDDLMTFIEGNLTALISFVALKGPAQKKKALSAGCCILNHFNLVLNII